MEESKTTTPQTPEETKIDRRRALKIIAATGGAITASSLLPGEWVEPVVEMGVLPADAQQPSPLPDNPVISNLAFALAPGGSETDTASDPTSGNAVQPPTFIFTGTTDYEDPACEVDDTATLYLTTSCGEIIFTGPINGLPGILNGTACQGSLFLQNFSYSGNCYDFCLILGVGVRNSNKLCKVPLLPT